jgi:hypothetical protein
MGRRIEDTPPESESTAERDLAVRRTLSQRVMFETLGLLPPAHKHYERLDQAADRLARVEAYELTLREGGQFDAYLECLTARGVTHPSRALAVEKRR